MFYNKVASQEYRRAQRRMSIEKVLAPFGVALGYYYGDLSIAVVIGLGSIIYLLGEIQQLIHYGNFMTEKSIGLHDLQD